MKKTSIMLLQMLSSLSLMAQWQQLEIQTPDLPAVTTVSVVGNNTIWASMGDDNPAFTGRVYYIRSTDGGQTWANGKVIEGDYSASSSRATSGTVRGNNYVLAQGNNTVYIYNGSGTVATFPLQKFLTVKVGQ